MNRKNKKKEELPDYTVANMDLDGMPWNSGRPGMTGGKAPETNPFLMPQEELTGEERRTMVWIALKAALTIGGVFVLAAFLFLLFCVTVWLR